jgi:hypothetical protein
MPGNLFGAGKNVVDGWLPGATSSDLRLRGSRPPPACEPGWFSPRRRRSDRHRSVELQFPSLALYTIPVSPHRDLDPQFPNETARHDLIAYKNSPLRTSLFVLPAQWKL